MTKTTKAPYENISTQSLAIILVNWFSYEVTRNCLISLKDLNYLNYSIIVVDNASEDGSGERLKNEFSEIIYLSNEQNLGFTGGNNVGIKLALESGFDLIMLLNNDTVVTPDFASILIGTLNSDPMIGAVQPKIRLNKNRDVIWNAGSYFNSFLATSKSRGYGEIDKSQYDEQMNLPWITGCCFLTSSEIIKEVGLLDQRFFCYYEDTDWSFKIRKLGFRLVYEPGALIYHEVGMSNEKNKVSGEGNLSPFSHYVTVRNHLYIVRRYSRGINMIGAWTNQVFKFIGYCGYFLLRRRFTN
jgi:GT2 family glycosyltransferase